MQRSSPAALLNEKPLWPYTCSASRPRQVPKVPTCSSTTCPRSLETRTYSRCSCLSETWSLPKSSSTNRQTLASASVRRQHRRQCVQTHWNACCYLSFSFFASCVPVQELRTLKDTAPQCRVSQMKARVNWMPYSCHGEILIIPSFWLINTIYFSTAHTHTHWK